MLHALIMRMKKLSLHPLDFNWKVLIDLETKPRALIGQISQPPRPDVPNVYNVISTLAIKPRSRNRTQDP